MNFKIEIVLLCIFSLVGTIISIPLVNPNVESVETTRELKHLTVDEGRQLDAIIASFLPALQSTLSAAIQNAVTGLLGNFSLFDFLRNENLRSEGEVNNPNYDSYVIKIPNIGSFVILANKPNEHDHTSYPDKPSYVSEYAIEKPHLPSIADYNLTHKPAEKENLFEYYKNKKSEYITQLQNHLQKQKDKIIHDAVAHFNHHFKKAPTAPVVEHHEHYSDHDEQPHKKPKLHIVPITHDFDGLKNKY